MSQQQTSPSSSVQEFAKHAHIDYIQHLEEKEQTTFEYCVTEHLRMSGMYWGLTGMDLMSESSKMNREHILQFIRDSYHADVGGFAGAPNHDAHILYTLSAVQLLVLLTSNIEEFLTLEQIEKIGEFIGSLQKEDGSFSGDKWGEIDTRFSYCALNCLALLGLLETCSNYRGDKINNKKYINVEKTVDYVLSCQNFDGGFGVCPGAESHAGQIFTCVGALSIAKALDRFDHDTLSWWLCERQCENGGLNGRPEKLSDVFVFDLSEDEEEENTFSKAKKIISSPPSLDPEINSKKRKSSVVSSNDEESPSSGSEKQTNFKKVKQDNRSTIHKSIDSFRKMKEAGHSASKVSHISVISDSSDEEKSPPSNNSAILISSDEEDDDVDSSVQHILNYRGHHASSSNVKSSPSSSKSKPAKASSSKADSETKYTVQTYLNFKKKRTSRQDTDSDSEEDRVVSPEK
ncbi:predicted protein, partial [Naegleria gruberi]